MIREANSIAIVMQEIRRYKGRLADKGATVGRFKYWYLGKGDLREGITDKHFEGEQEDEEGRVQQRSEGYYAAAMVGEDDVPITNPWVGVYRPPGSTIGLERSHTSDSAFSGALEEWKQLVDMAKRDVAREREQRRNAEKERDEIRETLDIVRRARDEALNEASVAKSEARRAMDECALEVQRRQELEDEQASFNPHIAMAVDRIAYRWAPSLGKAIGINTAPEDMISSTMCTMALFEVMWTHEFARPLFDPKCDWNRVRVAVGYMMRNNGATEVSDVDVGPDAWPMMRRLIFDATGKDMEQPVWKSDVDAQPVIEVNQPQDQAPPTEQQREQEEATS